MAAHPVAALPVTPNASSGGGGGGGGGTIKIIRRTDKSPLMSFLHICLQPFKPRLVVPKSYSADGSQKLTPPRKAKERCLVKERQVDGIWVYDLTPQGTDGDESWRERDKDAKKKRLVYFAGGGWQMPPSDAHWAMAAELVNRVRDLTVSIVSYPLAPKSPASKSMPQLRKLYDTLMDEATGLGEHVVFGGDSSGGNIAISLVIWALSESEVESAERTAPKAILAVSPSIDLRHIDDGLHDLDKNDPLLTVPFVTSTAQAWSAGGKSNHPPNKVIKNTLSHINTSGADGWSASDPRVSPVLADLGPLVRHRVKLYCVTGTWDILSLETHQFRDKCDKAGVEGEWLEWERQMHCFPMAFAYGLRESREGLEWMAEKLRQI
jgi:acetyl esterase/lipase